MALFGKKSASDILKMIAELPDDEKAMLMSTLANESEEDAAEPAPEEENAEEEETATEAPEAEEPAAEGEETMPEAEEVAEPEAEPAEEAEPEAEEPAEEQPAEALAEAEEKQDRDFGAELNSLAEAIAALTNRVDALDAKKAEASEDDEFGQAFGPDITNPAKTEDDELEKARRAAFGF